MSYCKDEGKDRIIISTKEDLLEPIQPDVQKILDIDIEEEGPLKANGEINWNCPCLGGMTAGPCGYEFRQSFSCFHDSKADPKGSDCLEQFQAMNECFKRFPDLYGKGAQDDDDDEGDEPDYLDESQDSAVISKGQLSAQAQSTAPAS